MTDRTDRSRWVFTLYINGASRHSIAAVETVRRVCDEELAGQVELRVVDVHDVPAQVAADQVLALPTLVKRLPPPLRQLVGDLADGRRIRLALELVPAQESEEGDSEGRRRGDHGTPGP